jgi:hypothetical protein
VVREEPDNLCRGLAVPSLRTCTSLLTSSTEQRTVSGPLDPVPADVSGCFARPIQLLSSIAVCYSHSVVPKTGKAVSYRPGASAAVRRTLTG